MSFTYDDEGIRTSKTVNGVTTNYYYQGSLLYAEETNSQITVYLYDENGAPIGFMYRGADYGNGVWDIYAFEKNIQGDVVAVYNASTGVKLISYKYNAWGECTTAYYNGGASTTAAKNPYKYRGYYYDSNLGLYYLQTRYYDVKTSRFISPDTASILTATPAALTDKNLYAYCDNNPVMRVDEDGEFWLELGIMAAGGIIGAFTNGIASTVSQYIINGNIDIESVAIAAASGFVSGAIAASPLGIVGQVIAGGVIGGLSYVADAHANEEDVSEVGLAVAIGTGLVSGAIGGKGANHNQQLTIAITGVRNTKVFAPVMNSSREAASIIAKAIVRRDNIIGPAIKKYVICSGVSSLVNEFAGKYFN